jgi:hypothetical protein
MIDPYAAQLLLCLGGLFVCLVAVIGVGGAIALSFTLESKR